MKILLPLEQLVSGKCAENFREFTREKKTETYIKTAFVAVSVGLVVALVSAWLAPIAVALTGIYIFAYSTTNFSPPEGFALKCAANVKEENPYKQYL
jgi:hypothetical protein